MAHIQSAELHGALGTRNWKRVMQLVRANPKQAQAVRVNLGGENQRGNTVLHEVVRANKIDLIDELVTYTFFDADIMNQETGITPLHLAARLNHGDCILKLLTWRANMDLGSEKTGYTPLMEAARGNSEGAVAVLLNNGADVNTPRADTTPLIIAADEGHVRVTRLLMKRPEISYNRVRTSDRMSALAVAVDKGHTEVVKALLESGDRSFIDQRFGRNETALHIAIKKENREDIAKILVEMGADIALRDCNGQTPLSLLRNDPQRLEYILPGRFKSFIEDSFEEIVTDNEITLDLAYLKRVLRPEYVRSVASLYYAHNLVLLGLRTGAVSRRELFCDGTNRSEFLRKNLYEPTGNLTLSVDGQEFALRVLEHARYTGLIDDISNEVKQRWGAKECMQQELLNIRNSINDLSKNVVRLEEHIMNVEQGIVEAFQRISSLAHMTEAQKRDIASLSRSFSILHSRLRKFDRRMGFIAVSKVLVNLIPIVSIPAVQAVEGLLWGLTMKDISDLLANVGLELLGKNIVPDLGNPRMLNMLLSESAIQAQQRNSDPTHGTPVRQSLQTAAETSEFGSLQNLRHMLTEALQSPDWSDDIYPDFIDAQRHDTTNCECGLALSKAVQHSRIREDARAQYRKAREQPRGARQTRSSKDLSIQEAKQELQKLLENTSDVARVTDSDATEILIWAQGNNGSVSQLRRVSEDQFERASCELHTRLGILDPLEFSRAFAAAAGCLHEPLCIAVSAVIVHKYLIPAATSGDGSDAQSTTSGSSLLTPLRRDVTAKQIEEIARDFARPGSNFVNYNEFRMVCRNIFYGSPRARSQMDRFFRSIQARLEQPRPGNTTALTPAKNMSGRAARPRSYS